LTHAPRAWCFIVEWSAAAYSICGITHILGTVDAVVTVDALAPQIAVATRDDIAGALIQGGVAVFRAASETKLAVVIPNTQTGAVRVDASDRSPEAVPATLADTGVVLGTLGGARGEALEQGFGVPPQASKTRSLAALGNHVDELRIAEGLQIILACASAR
jgi:hypothetical protein